MIINNKKITDRENGTLKDPTDAKYVGVQHSSQNSINFYDSPPHDIIGIYEFQNIAVSRLQVLKKIQFLYDSNKEGLHEMMAKEINTYSRNHKLNVEGLYDDTRKNFGRIPAKELMAATKNDNISHFICRLAYCRNDDLRKWFATQETRLFFHRFSY